ncbi:MAG TPA: hypothetical protein VIK86_05125, partial [Candidatus Paceibacterota bacterium]
NQSIRTIICNLVNYSIRPGISGRSSRKEDAQILSFLFQYLYWILLRIEGKREHCLIIKLKNWIL